MYARHLELPTWIAWKPSDSSPTNNFGQNLAM